MAAPFGPPPSLAITCTGPSGKRSPEAIRVNGGVIVTIFASCGPGAPGPRAGSASLDTGCTLLQDLTTAGPVIHGGQRHDSQHAREGRARGRGGEPAATGLPERGAAGRADGDGER